MTFTPLCICSLASLVPCSSVTNENKSFWHQRNLRTCPSLPEHTFHAAEEDEKERELEEEEEGEVINLISSSDSENGAAGAAGQIVQTGSAPSPVLSDHGH